MSRVFQVFAILTLGSQKVANAGSKRLGGTLERQSNLPIFVNNKVTLLIFENFSGCGLDGTFLVPIRLPNHGTPTQLRVLHRIVPGIRTAHEMPDTLDRPGLPINEPFVSIDNS